MLLTWLTQEKFKTRKEKPSSSNPCPVLPDMLFRSTSRSCSRLIHSAPAATALVGAGALTFLACGDWRPARRLSLALTGMPEWQQNSVNEQNDHLFNETEYMGTAMFMTAALQLNDACAQRVRLSRKATLRNEYDYGTRAT